MLLTAWRPDCGLCDEVEPSEEDEQWLVDDISGRLEGAPELDTTRAHTPGTPPTLYLYVMYDSSYAGIDPLGKDITYHMVGGLIYAYVPGGGYSYVDNIYGGGSNIPEESLDFYLDLAQDALALELEDKVLGWPDTEEMGLTEPEEETEVEEAEEEEPAAGTTEGEEEEGGTTRLHSPSGEPTTEGGRDPWWGAVTTLLVSLTALIAAAGPFVAGALGGASKAVFEVAQQAGYPQVAEEQMVREALLAECKRMRVQQKMSTPELKQFNKWIKNPGIPANEIILRMKMLQNSERDYFQFKQDMVDTMIGEIVELGIDFVSPWNKLEMMWDVYDTPTTALEMVTKYKNAPAPAYEEFVNTYGEGRGALTKMREEAYEEYHEWEWRASKMPTFAGAKSADQVEAEHRMELLAFKMKAIDARLKYLPRREPR